MLKNILLIYFQKSKLADFEPKLTILSPYISVNTHAREILSSGNDSTRKINSEKLLYILKNVLLTYFRKSKLADIWTKFGFNSDSLEERINSDSLEERISINFINYGTPKIPEKKGKFGGDD